MAAVIAVGTLVLAADGVTLTGTLLGGTGAGYAITNANGLQPHVSAGGGGQFIIPTAVPTVVGTTLTIVLPTPFVSGVTVQLNVTAANTIVDGGANTGAVATNTAVTNNATQTAATTNIPANLSSFNFLGALSLAGGGVTTFSPAVAQSPVAAANFGYPIEFVVNVTVNGVNIDVEAFLGSTGAGIMVWSVDGAAAQTYQGSNTSFEWVRLATGLNVGKHLIRCGAPQNNYTKSFRFTGAGSSSIVGNGMPNAIFRDNQANLTVANGVSPVARWGSTKYSGASLQINCNHTGFQFRAAGNFQGLGMVAYTGLGGGVSSYYAVDTTTPAGLNSYTSWSLPDPGATLRGLLVGYPLVAGLSPAAHTVELLDNGISLYDTVFAFNGSALTSAASIGDPSIAVADITNIQDGDWLILDSLQNEEPVQVASHAGAGPYALTLASTLAKAHASGVAARAVAPPNAPTLTAAGAPAFLGRLMFMGDSLTAAASLTTANVTPAPGYFNYDIRASYAAMAARAAGYDVIDAATQGWTAGQVASDNAPGTYNLGQSITSYATLIGTNDYGSGNTLGATFQANITSIINNIKTRSPGGAQILFIRIFSQTPGTTPNGRGLTITDYNNLIQAAITAAAQSGFVFQFVSLATLAGLNLAGTNSPDIPDNTHPSITAGLLAGTGGQNKLANALLPFFGVPANVTPPVVSGTAQVGQTLTTTNGTWSDNGLPTFTYQWWRDTNATPVGGATSQTYALVAADKTHLIGVTVTDTDLGGAASAGSNTVGPVVAAAAGGDAPGGAAGILLRLIGV